MSSSFFFWGFAHVLGEVFEKYARKKVQIIALRQPVILVEGTEWQPIYRPATFYSSTANMLLKGVTELRECLIKKFHNKAVEHNRIQKFSTIQQAHEWITGEIVRTNYRINPNEMLSHLIYIIDSRKGRWRVGQVK